MGLFENRKETSSGNKIVPTWFMRQAGRYHKHYQGLKKVHSFMELCKDPELSCQVTLGPVDEFNFDAAILFSDLLFPLELIGMPLSYDSGKPILGFQIENFSDISKLKRDLSQKEIQDYFSFQSEALKKISNILTKDKELLGFVGGPFTLFTYAVEGLHSGNLINSKRKLYDGTYQKFSELILPIILENMLIQANSGAHAINIMDTACGELSLQDFNRFIVPHINWLCLEFKKHSNAKIIFYSKMTHLDYFEELNSKHLDGLGIDWRLSLKDTLSKYSKHYYIQGNIDPSWLFLNWNDLEINVLKLFQKLNECNCNLDKWVFGLGHGILPKTPEDNVKNLVKLVHQKFIYE